MIKVGITGGIGSGKSTVCRLFAERGVAVYDSDAAAKRLMEEDSALRQQLIERFGAQTFSGEALNRAYLGAVVFRDSQALADLNALVHPAVMRDFERWAAHQKGNYVLMESAILFEAGLEGYFDRTIAVLAPRELRIERAMHRDHCDREQIIHRMDAQLDDDTLRDRADYAIVNILEEDLEPTVAELDQRFNREGAQQKPS